MAPWEKSVYSTMVSSISYDPDTEELTVIWTKGKPGVYSGVPESLAEELSRSASVGGMIQSTFKGSVPYRRL